MSNYSHECGASILNDRWLLSAGHCLMLLGDETLADYRVVCGVTDLTKVEPDQIFTINQTITHPKFNFNFINVSIEYDFRLIQLNRPLPLGNDSTHFASICLPESQPLDKIAGSTCIATGWGVSSRDPTEEPKTILQKAFFKILPQPQCIKRWAHKIKTDVKPIGIKDTHMCIEGGATSACNGDSGGPCSVWQSGRWYLYGVASMADKFNYTCIETSKTPNIYSRVSMASEWIWQTIAEYA